MVISEIKKSKKIKKEYEEGANGEGRGERNVYNLTVLITREMQTKTIRYNFPPILLETKEKLLLIIGYNVGEIISSIL